MGIDARGREEDKVRELSRAISGAEKEEKENIKTLLALKVSGQYVNKLSARSTISGEL